MSCFSGDSKILTRNGYRDIKDLANDYGFQSPVIVWNGTKWIPAHFYITNQKIKLYNISFRYYTTWEDEAIISCTKYTTFKINNSLITVSELKDCIRYLDNPNSLINIKLIIEKIGKIDGLPTLDKYLIPHKIPEGFIEVELVDNARIEEISDGGYEEAYGSDADSLIVNDILVY